MLDIQNLLKNGKHFKIYADLDTDLVKNVELAKALSLPPLEDRQPDLQYLTSVFVSSGMNLNNAFFLPSELIKAHKSVSDKPLDIEHQEDQIVGHIRAHAFVYKDKSPLDIEERLLSIEKGEDVENTPIDIITSATIYKTRFPEVAEDVQNGKYKVSMECYYRDFDVIVNGIIIPKEESKRLGLLDQVTRKVRVVEGAKELGSYTIGRVLRDIWFYGKGLVEKPANPESVILETASESPFILDLNKVDSYKKLKQSNEALVVNSLVKEKTEEIFTEHAGNAGGVHSHEFEVGKSKTFMDGSHMHRVWYDALPEDVLGIYFIKDGTHRHPVDDQGNMMEGSSHVHKYYVEMRDGRWLASETSSSSNASHTHFFEGRSYNGPLEIQDEEYSPKMAGPIGKSIEYLDNYGFSQEDGSHSHTIKLPNGQEIMTIIPSDILKDDDLEAASDKKELGGEGNVDGHNLSKPHVCSHFKRYLYSHNFDNEVPGKYGEAEQTPGFIEQIDSIPMPPTPGFGDNPVPGSEVVAENWCNLFDTACTTLGGEPSSGKCLRNVLNRTTKEVVTNHFEVMLEERRKRGFKSSLLSLDEAIQKARASLKKK